MMGIDHPITIDQDNNVLFQINDQKSMFYAHLNLVNSIYRFASVNLSNQILEEFNLLIEGKAEGKPYNIYEKITTMASIVVPIMKESFRNEQNNILNSTLEFYIEMLDNENIENACLAAYYLAQIYQVLRRNEYQSALQPIITKLMAYFRREEVILHAVAAECLSKLFYFSGYKEEDRRDWLIFVNGPTPGNEELSPEPLIPIIMDNFGKILQIVNQNSHVSLIKLVCSIELMLEQKLNVMKKDESQLEAKPEEVEEFRAYKDNFFGNVYNFVRTSFENALNNFNLDNPATVAQYCHFCDVYLAYEVLINPDSDENNPISILNPYVSELYGGIHQIVRTLLESYAGYQTREKQDENMIILLRNSIEKTLQVFNMILKTFVPIKSINVLGQSFISDIFGMFSDLPNSCFVPYVFTFLRNSTFYVQYVDPDFWKINDGIPTNLVNILRFTIIENPNILCVPEILNYLARLIDSRYVSIDLIPQEELKLLIRYSLFYMENDDLKSSLAAHKLLHTIISTICDLGQDMRDSIFETDMNIDQDNEIRIGDYIFIEMLRICSTGKTKFAFAEYAKIVNLSNYTNPLTESIDYFVDVLSNILSSDPQIVRSLIEGIITNSHTEFLQRFICTYSGLSKHDPELDFSRNKKPYSRLKSESDKVEDKLIPAYNHEEDTVVQESSIYF
ncbi:hypothetical protein TVAG_189730 [Trichomonas vaginalis G3]|uniref:Uncharacterized protein n=1 Tax=Trichomonas vaginalis (strain ATCC PRA-98 / G3) TaxID=412133 RepID=A2DKA5_TRIV3|nr:armadillo (ARM) repeat-containing protein family [Trichomonas vaginalis G3]EAY19082.1 hypothetical protein TVAG_189730 [Trichomonas vaginalis G3]KAI5490382.1 armadillo (ARM) repeat-containing protein family [Trichomonas vaginalis G3]|eukprot:XP_001580068.1 hypothetical protein [Trichomonas vaginalis G3]